MMRTRLQPRGTRALMLGALLIVTGLLATGCSSSGAARQGGSGGSTTATTNATRQSSEGQAAQSADSGTTDKAATADPVKVLRLPEVREQLEEAAADWYGTPYDWGGNSKQGVDCSGFVKNVYVEAFGHNLPRVTETQLQSGPKVARDQIRPGDLVFFRPNNEYNHVGVYLGEDTFAHASSSNGVTKSSIQNNYWKKYYWTSRRPLTPSAVPDTLTSELLAYKYPGSDSTARVTDASESAPQEANDEAETTQASGTDRSGATKIASCDAAGVDCADPSSSTASSDSENNTTRKGW